MNITDAEFDGFVAVLKTVLLKNGIDTKDIKRLLDAVELTRDDIVRGNLAPPVPVPVVKKMMPPSTLWERIGEEKGAEKIVDDFLDPAMKNPKVDFFRGDKYKMNAVQIKMMKGKFVDLISEHGKGPRKFDGKPLWETHQPMNISDAEFDALLVHLKESLVHNKVASEDVIGMMAAAEQLRDRIVSGKKAAPVAAPAKEKSAPPDNKGARREQPPNKPRATSAAAKAVIDRAIRALGGEEKLTAALKGCTWKTKGTLSIIGSEGPISTDSTIAGLGRYRYKFKAEFGGMEIEGISVLNGDKGLRSFAGNDMELDKDELTNESRIAYLLASSALIVPLKQSGFSCESEGEENVNNKPAVVLKVIGPDGMDSKLYLDRQSGLPVKQEARITNFRGQEVTQETLFSDYKEMGGIQKAARTIVKHDGEKYLELETTEFKILDKVDPKLFEKP
jgi:truncated hemoglobin YjbI